MVERTTDPNHLVAVHGIGRLADDQIVKRPRPPLPLATREFVYGIICAGIVLALTAAGIIREMLP